MRVMSSVGILALCQLGFGPSAGAADPGPGSNLVAYLGETPPTNIPKVFAPGVVSGVAGRNSATITFSPDGKTAFFYSQQGPGSHTMVTELRDGAWTAPVRAGFSQDRIAVEPGFSPDGTRVYFATNASAGFQGGSDLVYVEKAGPSWTKTGEPVNVGAPVNTAGWEFHPCRVADGSLYYTGDGGAILRSQFRDGAYQAPVALPSPVNLAPASADDPDYGDPYVPPDERYLLFKSKRAGGLGGFDLYISYHQADGSWSAPRNLGAPINSEKDEVAGDVTPDGKYLFFGRGGSIYWVRTDFIEALRPTL